MKAKYFIFLGVLFFLNSCVAVRPHEMVYLNDREMQMGSAVDKNFENYVESIREGSMPPASAKTGGGCGCN